MTVSKNFQPLNSGEVLAVSNESKVVIGHSTFRVSEFTDALKQLMLENGVGGLTPEKIDWLTENGIDCDVLRFGSDGWVKGKVRLHLEFCEESDQEASLDPKTEAAIEPFAPVAAAVASESIDTLDNELPFDDLFESNDLLGEYSLEEELEDGLDLDSEQEARADLETTDFNSEEESSAEFASGELGSAVELSASDDLDDLFDEEDGLLEDAFSISSSEESELEIDENDDLDDLFGDDSLEEISSDMDGLDVFLEEDDAIPEEKGNASITLEEQSFETLDVSSGEMGLDELFAEDSPSSTSDEGVLCDPFDESADSVIGNIEDLAGLELEDESAFTFNDFEKGNSEEAVLESAEDSSDDFGSDKPFFIDEDDIDLTVDGADAIHDDFFSDDDESVSSSFESFSDGGEAEIARVQLDKDSDSGSFTLDAGGLGGDDLIEDELLPEIDVGFTADLGEFIDVSMMRKNSPLIESENKTESQPMSSPFDLGDSSFIDENSDDDDSSDDNFSFYELGEDDPLNSVTGEEEEVSAGIWDLE